MIKVTIKITNPDPETTKIYTDLQNNEKMENLIYKRTGAEMPTDPKTLCYAML